MHKCTACKLLTADVGDAVRHQGYNPNCIATDHRLPVLPLALGLQSVIVVMHGR